MAKTPSSTQQHFRIRSDTNSADGGTPTWVTTEDQATTLNWQLDTMFRVRFCLDNTGAASQFGGGSRVNVYYSINGNPYVAVGALGSTVAAVSFADGDNSGGAADITIATGNFLLTAGAGTPETGEYIENSSSSVPALAAGDYTEIEAGLILNSAAMAVADYVDIRIYAGSSPIAAYAKTPRITASNPPMRTDRMFAMFW